MSTPARAQEVDLADFLRSSPSPDWWAQNMKTGLHSYAPGERGLSLRSAQEVGLIDFLCGIHRGQRRI
ncbi:hypothetical protein [Kitasatospora sp. NPDC091276]|uniref:hypothetical protein n=1 Tax=Kitasatospora sp. NPDC091276 TaxID=3155300 RepID=UPI00343C72F6